MTTGQFNFSFSVGIALIALGSVIIAKSTVGFSLIALGAGVAALAVLTRGARRQGATLPAAEPVGQFRDPATDH